MVLTYKESRITPQKRKKVDIEEERELDEDNVRRKKIRSREEEKIFGITFGIN